MNKAQKKIVNRWLLMSFAITLLITFSDFIQTNWDTIRWPAFIGIMVLSLFHKSSRSHSEGRFEINRIAEENLWVKTYLAIYLFIISIGASYVIYNSIKLDVGANGLLLAIGLLALPILMIQQKEAYINAGKEI